MSQVTLVSGLKGQEDLALEAALTVLDSSPDFHFFFLYYS